MPRLITPALAAASLALLAACEPPAQATPTAPVTAPGLGTGAASGGSVGGEPAATAADQVQVEPIPGLGD